MSYAPNDLFSIHSNNIIINNSIPPSTQFSYTLESYNNVLIVNQSIDGQSWNIITFNANNTITFNNNNTNNIVSVIVVGGGGGGGGGINNSTGQQGGGGGGSGGIIKIENAILSNGMYNINVGTNGLTGGGDNPGGNGGDSSISINNNNLVIAEGGNGGGAWYYNGPAGGQSGNSSTTLDINISQIQQLSGGSGGNAYSSSGSTATSGYNMSPIQINTQINTSYYFGGGGGGGNIGNIFPSNNVYGYNDAGYAGYAGYGGGITYDNSPIYGNEMGFNGQSGSSIGSGGGGGGLPSSIAISSGGFGGHGQVIFMINMSQ